jgi:coproporphyrinogen III oxidase-like Fe-S oxidoreductase
MNTLQSDSEHLSFPKAAYIHVPFCHTRCPYCSFTVVADRLDLVDRYVQAITRELSTLDSPNPVNTIFIGGGTPTLLPREPMVQLFSEIRRWLPLADDGEWSIEANPQDIDPTLCQLLRDQGINRISLGGQSFDSAKLKMLGRDHTGDQLTRSIDIASHGFAEVGRLDLRRPRRRYASLAIRSENGYFAWCKPPVHLWANLRERCPLLVTTSEGADHGSRGRSRAGDVSLRD